MPAVLNVNDVVPPELSVTFLDQFLLIEVTVWLPVTAFHVTLVPWTTDVDAGFHLYPEAQLLHDTALITTADEAGCTTRAPKQKTHCDDQRDAMTHAVLPDSVSVQPNARLLATCLLRYGGGDGSGS